MKQLIVMTATIMLGICLFRLIAGPAEESILSSVGQLWQQEIEMRTAEP
ncbi:MAG: hypothetical protein IJ486_03860 [Firmicutes bacterium]|nr:hypothetical protein [Bacillota bacterium]